MSVIKLVDLDLKGKRIFIRADLNVPVKDGKSLRMHALRPQWPRLIIVWGPVRK